jgi:hypothetical protein
LGVDILQPVELELQRGEGTMIPRRIDTERIIKDIKSGMGDIRIMEKYLISAEELMAILRKLEKAQAIAKNEIARLMPSYKAKSDQGQMRAVPRNYIFLTVHIQDRSDPKQIGVLNDISSKGLQVSGIETTVGDVRTFSVRSGAFQLETSLLLEGVCRWVRFDDNAGEPVAGFEIKRMSRSGQDELQRLIQELTIREIF